MVGRWEESIGLRGSAWRKHLSEMLPTLVSYLRSDARKGLAEHVVSPTSEPTQGEEKCADLQTSTTVSEGRDTPKSHLELPSTLYMKVRVYKTWMTLQLVPESILALLASSFPK